MDLPEPEPEPETADEPSAETPPEPKDDSQEDEPSASQDDEASQDGEEQEAKDDEEKASEEDAETVELDADVLSETLGIPVTVTDEGALLVTTNVDGEEGDATLQDLVRSYQTDKHLSNRGKRIEAEERAAGERMAHQKQVSDQNHQVLAALLMEAQNLLNPFAQIDMEKLRQDDPGQYAAVQTDMRNWQQQLEGIAQRALQAHQQMDGETKAEEKRTKTLELQAEGKRLTELIPDYSDAMEAEIRDWVSKTYKIPEEEVVIPQAWLIHAVNTAMHAAKGKKTLGNKRRQKTPKFVKSGARRSATAVAGDSITKAKSAHHKEGTVESAANVFRALRQKQQSANRKR